MCVNKQAMQVRYERQLSSIRKACLAGNPNYFDSVRIVSRGGL